MRLYLVRHAEAVPRGTPGYQHDAQRPLTDEGHAQAKSVGDGLKRLKIKPDVIVTSPYLRASQTAEHLARTFGMTSAVREADALHPEGTATDASMALRGLSMHEHVMLVGHEPHLSTWLGMLVAGEDGLRVLFKKAGVACVEVERVPPPRGTGTLRWIMTPKQLALIGTHDARHH